MEEATQAEKAEGLGDFRCCPASAWAQINARFVMTAAPVAKGKEVDLPAPEPGLLPFSAFYLPPSHMPMELYFEPYVAALARKAAPKVVVVAEAKLVALESSPVAEESQPSACAKAMLEEEALVVEQMKPAVKGPGDFRCAPPGAWALIHARFPCKATAAPLTPAAPVTSEAPAAPASPPQAAPQTSEAPTAPASPPQAAPQGAPTSSAKAAAGAAGARKAGAAVDKPEALKPEQPQRTSKDAPTRAAKQPASSSSPSQERRTTPGGETGVRRTLKSLSDIDSQITNNLGRFFSNEKVSRQVAGIVGSTQRSNPVENLGGPRVRTFRVQVPKPYPGVQWRKSKNLEDRYKRFAENGITISGQVEDNGQWLRVSDKIFIPMKVGSVQILEPVMTSPTQETGCEGQECWSMQVQRCSVQ